VLGDPVFALNARRLQDEIETGDRSSTERPVRRDSGRSLHLEHLFDVRC
jgi:hypothetical protein